MQATVSARRLVRSKRRPKIPRFSGLKLIQWASPSRHAISIDPGSVRLTKAGAIYLSRELVTRYSLTLSSGVLLYGNAAGSRVALGFFKRLDTKRHPGMHFLYR